MRGSGVRDSGQGQGVTRHGKQWRREGLQVVRERQDRRIVLSMATTKSQGM